jgi:hypothetical protein
MASSGSCMFQATSPVPICLPPGGKTSASPQVCPQHAQHALVGFKSLYRRTEHSPHAC